MQHVETEIPVGFVPFAVSIKIESVEDAIKIYSLFNSASVTESFEIPNEVHVDIRNHIVRKCPPKLVITNRFLKKPAKDYH